MFLAILLGLAQAASSPVSAPAAKPPATKEKMICEAEQTPGSRIAKRRICYTQQEWAAHKAQIATMMSKKQTSGYFQEGAGTCMRGVSC